MPNKITDFKNYKKHITNYDLANLFYIYEDRSVSNTAMTYNINRTIQFNGISKSDRGEFEYYEVLEADSWNLISFKHYNTTSLWWLICKINDVRNPTIDPQVGTVIRIMPESKVNSILHQIREL